MRESEKDFMTLLYDYEYIFPLCVVVVSLANISDYIFILITT